MEGMGGGVWIEAKYYLGRDVFIVAKREGNLERAYVGVEVSLRWTF